jgi:hypothetical protein
MKKVYFPPTMTVVEYQQMNHILAGSLNGVNSNVDLGYGGGGTEDPMSPGFNDFGDF